MRFRRPRRRGGASAARPRGLTERGRKDQRARALPPVLVPGAYLLTASNALLSHTVAMAVQSAGLEHRGKVTRLVHTMRGGDRPKYAHEEFPRGQRDPAVDARAWLLFRKRLDETIRDNLTKRRTGGLRRPARGGPFGDVIRSGRPEKAERALAPHPSPKPQAFLRQVVRAILPLAEGVVLDPFAGSGSTLAAAEAIGYKRLGSSSRRGRCGSQRRRSRASPRSRSARGAGSSATAGTCPEAPPLAWSPQDADRSFVTRVPTSRPGTRRSYSAAVFAESSLVRGARVIKPYGYAIGRRSRGPRRSDRASGHEESVLPAVRPGRRPRP
jgi:DNA methylase